MAGSVTSKWDGAVVRKWLGSRVVAARADQVAAQRGGRDREDDCDKATAEELVCALFKDSRSTDDRDAFLADLRALLARDDYVGRGVYDDTRFDRHVRSFIRKVMRMTRINEGFGNLLHHQ